MTTRRWIIVVMNVLLALFFIEMARGFAGFTAIVFTPLGLVLVLVPILITYLGIRQALRVFKSIQNSSLELNRLVRTLWIAPFFNALALLVGLIVVVAAILN